METGYDPGDPVIPLKGNIAGTSEEIYGIYVERKGIDTWTFGIHSPTESSRAMEALAIDLDLAGIVYPGYRFKRFER